MALSKVKTELIEDGAVTQSKLAAGVGASVSNATDVNSTVLEDGSVLVYSTSSQKWTATRQLENQVLNGGQY